MGSATIKRKLYKHKDGSYALMMVVRVGSVIFWNIPKGLEEGKT